MKIQDKSVKIEEYIKRGIMHVAEVMFRMGYVAPPTVGLVL